MAEVPKLVCRVIEIGEVGKRPIFRYSIAAMTKLMVAFKGSQMIFA